MPDLDHGLITIGAELAHEWPEILDLPEEELISLLWSAEVWLRPEQLPPDRPFRSCGWVAGRGWGKTYGIAAYIHMGVADGTIKAPCIGGPTEDRVYELQVEKLVASAPPWLPCEPYKGGVRWPTRMNYEGGMVTAVAHTPQGKQRGGNYDLAWLTELVEWPEGTEDGLSRREFWLNIDTATREGPSNGRMLWDTTSKGQNELILWLLERADEHPDLHIVRRGSMFDNPFLGRDYLRNQVTNYELGSRRYLEEIEGVVHSESAGALWQKSWIDGHRVATLPLRIETRLVSLDPAASNHSSADDCGIIVASAAPGRRDLYVEADLSAKLKPNQYADIVVRQCVHGAAGVVLERSKFGDHPIEAVRAKAAEYDMVVRVLDPKRPWPALVPGVIHVREKVSVSSKEVRAGGPAALYEAGRVHHVGTLDRLEHEQTTWEPGSRRSPNRLDAVAMALTELAGLDRKQPTPGPRDIRATEAMQAKLRQTLSARRVGL